MYRKLCNRAIKRKTEGDDDQREYKKRAVEVRTRQGRAPLITDHSPINFTFCKKIFFM